MKNAVSRFWVNRSRQSPRVTRVDGIQVSGAAPPATLTRPCRSPSARCACSIVAATPSSVATSAATGTIDNPRSTSGHDVVVEIFLGSAHRDDRRTGLGDHPGDSGADTATGGAGHHDHAPLEIEQVIDHSDVSTSLSGQNTTMRTIENMILCKWPSVKWSPVELCLAIVWTRLGC